MIGEIRIRTSKFSVSLISNKNVGGRVLVVIDRMYMQYRVQDDVYEVFGVMSTTGRPEPFLMKTFKSKFEAMDYMLTIGSGREEQPY